MTLKMIGIVNQSKRVTDAELGIMVAAVNAQVADDFAPAWGLLPVLTKQFSTLNQIPIDAETAAFVLVDASTEPGALGWHTEDRTGRVTGVIATDPVLDNGGVVLLDPSDINRVSVSSVLSHEVLETIADQFINYWADAPDGWSYAYEVGDPVEATSYLVEVEMVGSAAVSDFVLPAWFDPSGDGPWNFCHGVAPLKGAFELAPGGYCIRRKGGQGSEQQITAHAAHSRPWRKAGGVPKAGWRSSKRVPA